MAKTIAVRKAPEPEESTITAIAVSAGLYPWQREHELAEAILGLMIAISRYGANDDKARDTAERLASLEHITLLVASGVAERVRKLHGKQAETALRKALGRKSTRDLPRNDIGANPDETTP